ncbi:MAG: PadR family transcriptional regulator [Dehalococcoidia bacterium]
MSLRYVLLALLSKKPNSGYGLGRLLQRQLGHLWEARLQQIYGEMAKLQSAGLVEAEEIELPNRPAKKIYSLTPEGQEALDDWLAGRCSPHSHKDEMLVRLYCLERMPPDVLARRLEEQRDEYEAEVVDLRNRLSQVPRTDAAQAGLLLTLEAALAVAEAQGRWFEKAISWLDSAGAALAAEPSAESLRASA